MLADQCHPHTAWDAAPTVGTVVGASSLLLQLHKQPRPQSLRVTSSLSLEEPGPKKQLLPNASTAPLGMLLCTKGQTPRTDTPSPAEESLSRPHPLCHWACDTGTPARLPARRAQAGFPRAVLPAPGWLRWNKTGAGPFTGSSVTSQTDLVGSQGLPSLADAPETSRAL